ncbi:MAG: hypothetical protein JHD16_08855 [Solirubrobacteraceae bacterium]|nr:hypothetical protein [Solirubrobacteraceae bacterium]
MTDVLLAAGVLQLASAALLGWVIALQRAQPEALKKIGVRVPRRIMQVHLDQVMMGLILLSVAVAFPDIPDVIAVLLLIGTVLNPLLFVPLAFAPKLDEGLPFRALTVTSFLIASGAFVSLAVWVLFGR